MGERTEVWESQRRCGELNVGMGMQQRHWDPTEVWESQQRHTELMEARGSQ